MKTVKAWLILPRAKDDVQEEINGSPYGTLLCVFGSQAEALENGWKHYRDRDLKFDAVQVEIRPLKRRRKSA